MKRALLALGAAALLGATASAAQAHGARVHVNINIGGPSWCCAGPGYYPGPVTTYWAPSLVVQPQVVVVQAAPAAPEGTPTGYVAETKQIWQCGMVTSLNWGVRQVCGFVPVTRLVPVPARIDGSR